MPIRPFRPATVVAVSRSPVPSSQRPAIHLHPVRDGGGTPDTPSSPSVVLQSKVGLFCFLGSAYLRRRQPSERHPPNSAIRPLSTLGATRVPSGVVALTDAKLAFTGSNGSIGYSDTDALSPEHPFGMTPLLPIDCRIRNDLRMSRGETRTGLSLPSGMYGFPKTIRSST